MGIKLLCETCASVCARALGWDVLFISHCQKSVKTLCWYNHLIPSRKLGLFVQISPQISPPPTLPAKSPLSAAGQRKAQSWPSHSKQKTEPTTHSHKSSHYKQISGRLLVRHLHIQEGHLRDPSQNKEDQLLST